MFKTEQFVVLISSSQNEAQFLENLLESLQGDSRLSGIYKVQHIAIHTTRSTPDDGNFWHHFFQQHQRKAVALTTALQKQPFWNNCPDLDPELTLVGFRSSCSTIQEFLLETLNEDEDVRQIRRIYQVMFLAPLKSPATNIIGVLFVLSVVLSLIGIVLLVFWPDVPRFVGIGSAILGLFSIVATFLTIAASSDMLAVLGIDPQWFKERFQISQLSKEFKEKIEQGSRRKLGTWPVPCKPITYFMSNAGDRKVSQEKIRDEIVDTILKPPVHPNVYEFDVFEYVFSIDPVLSEEVPQVVRDNLVLREKYTSKAIYECHIHVADDDRTASVLPWRTCGDLQPWELCHKTSGYQEVQGDPSDNLATTQENFQKNKEYMYRFCPEPHKHYYLHVTVYGGYDDENSRNCHVHLRADTNIRLLRGTLDLRGYESKHWKLAKPIAFFFPNDIPRARVSSNPASQKRELKDLGCGCLSKKELGFEVPVEQISSGVFRWERLNIRNGGIVAFKFQVTPPILEKQE